MVDDSVKSFGETARGLARNPLGIIALFIVLVYSVAALVVAFAGSFTAAERLPLIWFMAVFPVLVLAVFGWLVSCHSEDLWGPGDYANEEHFLMRQMTSAIALALASAARSGGPVTQVSVESLMETVQETVRRKPARKESWHNRLLWVDDHPDNNLYERRALEAVGVQITLATSTNEALEHVKTQPYAAIISDMGRAEGEGAGYDLLDALRGLKIETPFFIYARAASPEFRKATAERGGQGNTNDPQELYRMVMRTMVSQS